MASSRFGVVVFEVDDKITLNAKNVNKSTRLFSSRQQGMFIGHRINRLQTPTIHFNKFYDNILLLNVLLGFITFDAA